MVASCAAMCILFGKVECIRMDCQYHITGTERDDFLLLGFSTIEELFDSFHCILGGGILFRGDGAEGWEPL